MTTWYLTPPPPLAATTTTTATTYSRYCFLVPPLAHTRYSPHTYLIRSTGDAPLRPAPASRSPGLASSPRHSTRTGDRCCRLSSADAPAPPCCSPPPPVPLPHDPIPLLLPAVPGRRIPPADPGLPPVCIGLAPPYDIAAPGDREGVPAPRLCCCCWWWWWLWVRCGLGWCGRNMSWPCRSRTRAAMAASPWCRCLCSSATAWRFSRSTCGGAWRAGGLPWCLVL